MLKFVTLFAMALSFAAGMNGAAVAGPSNYPLAQVEFDNSMEARRRGAVVATETCLMCHGFKYLKYRDLLDIGFTKEEVDDMRGENSMSSRLESMTPIEERKESYGKVPPDLTLMAIARKNGPEYIYTLLTTYYINEEGNEDNHLFPGIRMPDLLSYSLIETEEERVEIEQQVKDVTSFMIWAADPNAEARRTIGMYVIIYLVILTTLLYLLKKKIWRRVHKATMEHLEDKH